MICPECGEPAAPGRFDGSDEARLFRSMPSRLLLYFHNLLPVLGNNRSRRPWNMETP